MIRPLVRSGCLEQVQYQHLTYTCSQTAGAGTEPPCVPVSSSSPSLCAMWHSPAWLSSALLGSRVLCCSPFPWMSGDAYSCLREAVHFPILQKESCASLPQAPVLSGCMHRRGAVCAEQRKSRASPAEALLLHPAFPPSRSLWKQGNGGSVPLVPSPQPPKQHHDILLGGAMAMLVHLSSAKDSAPAAPVVAVHTCHAGKERVEKELSCLPPSRQTITPSPSPICHVH